MLAWKLTRFRISFQMERQISSIRTPRTLPAAAPTRSQTSDPCPALHITPEALEGQSRHHKAGDVPGAAAFGVFFPPSLEVRDLLGSGCAPPEHPPGMSRAGLGWAGGQELKGNAQELLRWDGGKLGTPGKGKIWIAQERGNHGVQSHHHPSGNLGKALSLLKGMPAASRGDGSTAPLLHPRQELEPLLEADVLPCQVMGAIREKASQGNLCPSLLTPLS